MVRCIERRLLRDLDYSQVELPYQKDELKAWRQRFFRAMYRLIVAAAVVFRAYNEPFFMAEKYKRPPFHSVPWKDHQGNVLKHAVRLTTGDVEYLRRFPIYNFDDVSDESKIGQWRSREYEKIFGPFADWIVADARALGVQENIRPWTNHDDIFLDSAGTGAIQEAVLLVAAFEEIGGNHFRPPEPIPDITRERKATTILFGDFQLAEVTTPALVKNAKNFPLVPEPLTLGGKDVKNVSEPSKEMLPPQPHLLDVLWELTNKSTRPNIHDGFLAPPPIYDLFVFVFRRPNLRFEERAFEPWADTGYQLEMVTGDIWTSLDYGAVIMQYRPPVLLFEAIRLLFCSYLRSGMNNSILVWPCCEPPHDLPCRFHVHTNLPRLFHMTISEEEMDSFDFV